MHVLLRPKVDSEVGERRLERRHHPFRRVALVELRRAEEPDDIPRARLVEPESEACAEQLVALLLPQRLRLVEQLAALLGELVEAEAEALVELVVVRGAELRDGGTVDLRGVEIDRVQVLVEQAHAGLLEPLPLVAVGLVRHRDAHHPVRDRLAVDGRLQLCLDSRDLRLVLAREVAEEALARESPELGRRALHLPCGVEPRQLLVALVDLLDVERLLETRVVEVELLVEIRDEAIRAVAERVDRARVDAASGWRLIRHASLGYGPVHELTVTTERHTQLLDITEQVRAAAAGADGAAVLVYVPHTTAGLTINEHADPMVARDFEMALERIAPEGWGWRHIEEGEENAPSHIRAALMGPQVVIPLRNGELALGTWQGIFFCELDGPRTRSVYVTVLR